MDNDNGEQLTALLGEIRFLRERAIHARAQYPDILESVHRLQDHTEHIIKLLSGQGRKSSHPYSQPAGRLQRALIEQKTGCFDFNPFGYLFPRPNVCGGDVRWISK
jgi:hypothetical protein